MSNVTRLIQQFQNGDGAAQEQLLSAVYDELRRLAAVKLASEKPGQTLQATALVHEAYLRLYDVAQPTQWNGRGHFFGAAAEAMRRILVENARRKGRLSCEVRASIASSATVKIRWKTETSRLSPVEG